MKRRAVLFFLIILCVLPGLVFSAGAREETQTYTLKIGHLSAVGGLEDLAVKRIAEVAEKNSNGRLKLDIYPAAQLGDFVSQMQSIAIGTQDIMWGDLGWLGNFVTDYQILIMPYAFRSQQHMFDFMDSDIGMELENKLEDQGYLLLTKHAYQLPKCVISSKPIRTASDLRGLKMRVPEWPIYLAGWEAMQTNPVVVTWGELYLALAQGVADAMTAGFEFIYPGKFHEVAPYITRTEHAYGVRGAILGTYTRDKLPADLMAILEEAALAGEQHYIELLEQAKLEHEAAILAEGGEIIDIDREALRKMVLPIVPRLEAEGRWSKGLFDKVQKL